MPQFTSSLGKLAFQIARDYQDIPEEVNDDEAMAAINPIWIELIMQIIMVLLQGCPQPGQTWKRIKSYVDATPTQRLGGDHIRLNWVLDRWMGKLAVPRSTGDIPTLREAVVTAVSGMKEEDFAKLQAEVMFLGI